MTASLKGSSGGSGIPDPAVKATNDALIYNGSAWIAQKVAAANIASLAVDTAQLANLGVTLAKLAAGAVDNSKIAAAAGIAVTKLAAGSDGQALVTVGTTPTWTTPAGGAPSGAAGGALTGSYPNPGLAAHKATHEPNGSDAIDWTGKIHQEGTEAALPAAATSNAGTLYRATDTGVIYRSTGTAWNAIAWNPRLMINGVGTYWTTPERLTGVANIAAATSGVMSLLPIFIPRGVVLTHLAALFASTGATMGTTGGTPHWWLALYGPDGTLRCSTADQGNAAIAANAWKDLVIARDSAGAAITTYTTPTSGVYKLGIMVNVGAGGTPVMPTRRAIDVLVNAVSDGIGSALALSQTVGTALAATPPANTTGAVTDSVVQQGAARI